MEKRFIDSIYDFYVRLVWTHKIQEKQADILISNHKAIRTIRVFANAITSSGVIAILITDSQWLKVVTAIIALVSLFFNGVGKEFDYETSAKNHKNSANQFLLIKDKLGFLIDDIKVDRIDSTEAIRKRDTLYSEFEGAIKSAPITTNKAVKKAEHALNIKRESTISEKEKTILIPRYEASNNE